LPYAHDLHNASLGGHRQKPIGALNAAWIGEGANKAKKNFIFLKIGEVAMEKSFRK
jgi:hypothetical protein